MRIFPVIETFLLVELSFPAIKKKTRSTKKHIQYFLNNLAISAELFPHLEADIQIGILITVTSYLGKSAHFQKKYFLCIGYPYS